MSRLIALWKDQFSELSSEDILDKKGNVLLIFTLVDCGKAWNWFRRDKTKPVLSMLAREVGTDGYMFLESLEPIDRNEFRGIGIKEVQNNPRWDEAVIRLAKKYYDEQHIEGIPHEILRDRLLESELKNLIVYTE